MAQGRFAIPVALSLLLIVFGYVAHALWIGYQPDDSYITYRFALSLAHGYGPVWNPGGKPVEGYTNFLWMVLLALANRMGVEIPLAATVLGLVFGSACLVLAWMLGRRLGLSAWWALLAPMWLALSTHFAAWGTSGMEVPLLCAGLLGMVVAYDWEQARGRGLWLTSLAALTLSLSRADGVVLVLTLAAAHTCWWGFRRQDLAPVLALGACYGAYLWWRHGYYGWWLPNTYYAKVGLTVPALTRGLQYVGGYLRGEGLLLIPVIVPLWWRKAGALRPPALVCWGGLAYGALVGGDFMPDYRFLVPCLVVGLPTAVATVARVRLARRKALAAAAALPVGVWLASGSLPWSGNYARVVYNRQVLSAGAALTARWIARHIPPHETVAVSAAGIVPYLLWPQPCLDERGLCDVHIAHCLSPGILGTGKAGHEKWDINYVRRKAPGVIIALVDGPVGGRPVRDARYQVVKVGVIEGTPPRPSVKVLFNVRRDLLVGGQWPGSNLSNVPRERDFSAAAVAGRGPVRLRSK